jgi:iron complex transport system ATP-binding protein
VSLPLRARGVAISFGGREILHGIDLDVRASEIAAIVGPNGAGKSTLLRALSGTVPIARGEVLLDGRTIADLRRIDVARKIAVVPQDVPPAPGFTVREVVAMGRAPHQGRWLRQSREDASIVDRAIARCRLEGLEDRPFAVLSGGERKRAVVAQALAQEPTILLLDEPSAFLDLRHAVELFEIAVERAAEGVAVVAIVHDLSLAARYAASVTLLVDGRIAAAGPPSEVLTEPTLTRAFGVPIARLDGGSGTVAFAPLPRSR